MQHILAEDRPWIKSWPPDVPQNLSYPKVPLFELLRKTAKNHPEKPAIVYFGRQITYAELDLLSDEFAVGLTRLGVEKGDRVAIFLPNIPQFIIAYYGILKAGAVLTAISPLYKEREVEHQLVDSEAKTIITLDSLYPIVKTVWQKTKLKNVVITNIDEYAKSGDSKLCLHKRVTGLPIPGSAKSGKPSVYGFSSTRLRTWQRYSTRVEQLVLRKRRCSLTRIWLPTRLPSPPGQSARSQKRLS